VTWNKNNEFSFKILPVNMGSISRTGSAKCDPELLSLNQKWLSYKLKELFIELVLPELVPKLNFTCLWEKWMNGEK